MPLRQTAGTGGKCSSVVDVSRRWRYGGWDLRVDDRISQPEDRTLTPAMITRSPKGNHESRQMSRYPTFYGSVINEGG